MQKVARRLHVHYAHQHTPLPRLLLYLRSPVKSISFICKNGLAVHLKCIGSTLGVHWQYIGSTFEVYWQFICRAE